MPIEILKEPQVQVQDGVTYHVLAVDRTPAEQAAEGQEQAQAVVRAVGTVAVFPSTMERYMDDDTSPYMIHDTMKVQGIVGGEAVYDKTISPKGFLGSPRPLYGLRIAVARKRAGHRVKSILST